MKIGVIGAGPAGVTAAYQLAKGGAQVHLFEASGSVGGLAKTIELWDQKVDIGPHRFFSKDARVNKVWLEVVGNDFEMVDRLTRIYYNKRFFYYPLKPFNALFNLGIFKAALCVLSYLKERLLPRKSTDCFEDWVTSRFGAKLYNIFFKTYSEKLWGISCRKLDSDFAAQRIKKLSLFEAIKNAILGGNDGKHKTLVDQFAYPHHGTGMVYERMAKAVEELGGKVRLKTAVRRILTEADRAVALELESGQIEKFDHIVSCMPLSLMVMSLPEAPEHIKVLAESLKFRNTIIVYLKVDCADLFDDNWLYVHSSDLQMGRITNFRNWVPQLYGDQKSSILALEYWCYDQDAFWGASDRYLVDLASEELRKSGLIGKAEISGGSVYRIKRCYPVYERGYRERLDPIEQYLNTIGSLSVIGRYGAFKYNNQDHSILMGLLAADNILRGAKHDLWAVNTDYDDYQESAIITKTGLVSVPSEDSKVVPITAVGDRREADQQDRAANL